LERSIEEQKKYFKDRNDPDALKQLIPSLEKMISELKEEETNYFRYRILFKGNDPGTGLRRVVSDRRTSADDKWESDHSNTMIMRGDIQKNNSTVRAGTVNHGEVRVSSSNYNVVQFQKFGRMQGMFSKTATVSMLDAGDLDRFTFLPNKVAEFKKTMEQLANQSGISILQIVGSTPYDDGKGNAIILESRNAKGIVYMRYWIDPSRGYICPLVQQYSPENGKILQEYSAKNYFLHDRSGLWYPQEYEEKMWNAQNGVLLESSQYKINPATFQINQPVSDQEFSIDIAGDIIVVDERVTPNATYAATERGALSLADGLNLSEMSWLDRLDGGDYLLQKGGVQSFWVRFCLAGTGLALIFIALFRMWRNRCAKGM